MSDIIIATVVVVVVGMFWDLLKEIRDNTRPRKREAMPAKPVKVSVKESAAYWERERQRDAEAEAAKVTQ